MLTQTQYQNVVFYASRANEALIQTLRAQEALGRYPKWNLASCQSLKIKSGKWSLLMQDYSSEASVDIYNQLLDIGSTWMGGIAIDPNAQGGGVLIISTDVVVGYNTNRIYFTNTTNWVLSNYNANYYPLYGDNPELFVYIDGGDFSGDDQTPPIITFTTPGDSSTPIAQIHWDRPVNATGYVQISGIAPGSGSSGSGASVITFNFTQSDLVLDGDGAYYLPISIGNKTILSVYVNGVQISATLDTNFTPNRLYGFANNDTQSIIVKVL